MAFFFGCLVLLGLALIRLSLPAGLARARAPQVSPAANLDTAPEPIAQPRWLSGDQSPLLRAVLDCRDFVRHRRVDLSDAKIVASFARTQRSPLSEVVGQLPEGADSAGHGVRFRYTAAEMAALRGECIPAALEDKWLIRHAAGRIYFQRSWTGKLIYVAELRADPVIHGTDLGGGEENGTGSVTRVWLRDGEERSAEQKALALAMVRYLIDSHLRGVAAAVPVPADLAEDVNKVALFAFAVAGRRGDYAEVFVL